MLVSFPALAQLSPGFKGKRLTISLVFLKTPPPATTIFYFVHLALPLLLYILCHTSVVQFYYRWPDFQCAFKTANADRLVLDSPERAAVWCPEIELEAITKAFGWTREKRQEKDIAYF